MSLRKLALAAISTALVSAPAALAAEEPATRPMTAPGTPRPPAIPGDAKTPVAPARTSADVDAELTKLFGESASFKTFFADLQKAAAAEDEKAVAKMVAYPFKTKVDGIDKTIAKEADFVKAYDDIMKPNILLAIRDQKYETLMATDMGVMIGSGQVWFAKSGAGADPAVKIIAINHNAGT